MDNGSDLNVDNEIANLIRATYTIKGKEKLFFEDDIDLDELDELFGEKDRENVKPNQKEIKIDVKEVKKLFDEYERKIEEEIENEMKETFKPRK